jgi:hypothetical protein
MLYTVKLIVKSITTVDVEANSQSEAEHAAMQLVYEPDRLPLKPTAAKVISAVLKPDLHE